MKKSLFGMLAVCSLGCVTSAALVLDQSQAAFDFGLTIGHPNLTRWQEFTPTYNNVAQIDLFFYRDPTGGSGGIDITLTDEGGNTLWNDMIADVSIPTSFNWINVPVDPLISLVPGQVYRIELAGQWDGGTLNWMGLKRSPYERGISDYLDNFDYRFRTWAVPEPMTMVLLGIGGLLLRKRRKVQNI